MDSIFFSLPSSLTPGRSTGSAWKIPDITAITLYADHTGRKTMTGFIFVIYERGILPFLRIRRSRGGFRND